MTPLTRRFESIEEAQEYVRLLREVVAETEELVGRDIAELNGEVGREEDALKLVDYKLRQLSEHLRSSSRLLNDLRTLRRILSGEREEAASQPDRADSALASDPLGI